MLQRDEQPSNIIDPIEVNKPNPREISSQFPIKRITEGQNVEVFSPFSLSQPLYPSTSKQTTNQRAAARGRLTKTR